MQKTAPLLARLNWYWTFQLTGWNLVALFNLMLNTWHAPSWSICAICWWGAACGLLLSDLWHRWLRRSGWLMHRRSWLLLLPALLLLGGLHTAAVTLAFVLLQPFGPVKGLAWLPGAWSFWIFMYLIWTGAYGLVLAGRRASRFEAEALRLEVLAKDAELKALQAQVNPHFFFNSMNSVRALIYEDPPAAARMIDKLTSLMRYALQSGQSDTVTLGAELEAVQAYLAIEKIRFEERMTVSVELAPGLEQVAIPPMALQTLVENAVKYGVEASPSGSEIRIRAGRYGGMVRIEIANLGAILPFVQSTRIGLHNARKRLALALGTEASLDLSEHGGWVRATLTVPEQA